MKTLGYKLNEESYIAFIQAFESDKHFHEMLEFVQHMKAEGLEVNQEIYRHLLHVAFKDTGDFRNFEFILNIVQDLGYQNHPRLIDIILRYTIQKQGLDKAQEMTMDLIKQNGYDEEAKSKIICTLLSGYLKDKNYEKVLFYVDFMDKNGKMNDFIQ